ncbi:DUF3857 and transglutaminase domain-containing protein [Gramella lutea]|uniref:DUF3857 and transglutaminase domain-containing protein n=1 Tax=Christiangramia lutea TaxID=1607951 RepID=A0A9X1V736_9FLAO|nr:DUF3857 domain-containing protein [Christiangramia lutea]MCH4824249.1 DUF3857 and transglutaminase domain-containing protein [Christiangramia lutea]
MKNISLLLILILGCTAYSQYAPEFEEYKAKYGDANKVIMNKEVVLNLDIKDNDLEITQENIEENLFMTDGANMAAREDLNFSYFFELLDIEAYSTVYNNDKPDEFKVDNFVEKDNMDNSFYDDSKSLVFLYPNLKKGAKSYIKYSERIKNPRFLGAFFLGDIFPIDHAKYSIVADKDITLSFREFNTEGIDIQYKKEEKWGKVIYTWEVKSVDKYKIEDNGPDFRSFLPHILPVITSYNSGGAQVNLSGSVNDLYDWYYSLVKDINNQAPDANLVKVVEGLTKNKASEIEKVKAIYYWTQDNIKYIAYEYALGGFIPREANLVFDRKYGDCKDNSSILKEMLEIAGIEGNLTWIGTRSISYKYDEVPTPLVDNHMILSYRDNNGEVYFLDGTGRYNPLEIPSSFIQGKEALIENGKGEYILEEVPVIPASRNVIRDTTILKIEGSELKGSSHARITGYGKIDYAFHLEEMDTESKIQEFYNYRFEKGNNKFLIDSLEEFNRTDYEKPLEVRYTFGIKDYIKDFGDEIYLNLNLNREVTSFKIDKPRKTAVEYEFTKTYDFKNTLKIPEAYGIEYLPENFKVSNDFFSAEINYSLQGKSLIYEFKAVLDFIILTPDQQSEFNSLLEDLEKAFKEVIILKKINN